MKLRHNSLDVELQDVLRGLPPDRIAAVCQLISGVVDACARVSDGYSRNIDDIEFYDDPRQWPEHISNRIRSLVCSGD